MRLALRYIKYQYIYVNFLDEIPYLKVANQFSEEDGDFIPDLDYLLRVSRWVFWEHLVISHTC